VAFPNEEARVAIEIEENTGRIDLESFDTSKERLAQAKAWEPEVFVQSTKTPTKGGRPPKGLVSRAAVAQEMRVSEGALRKAERHVSLAERYPEMKAWKQSEVLAVDEALAQLPEKGLPELPKPQREACESSAPISHSPTPIATDDVAPALSTPVSGMANRLRRGIGPAITRRSDTPARGSRLDRAQRCLAPGRALHSNGSAPRALALGSRVAALRASVNHRPMTVADTNPQREGSQDTDRL
jgi:hypothetical protein